MAPPASAIATFAAVKARPNADAEPTSTVNANLGDFSASTGIFEVWGEQLEQGQYQSPLIPTAAGPASGVNQINPNADSANLWSATNGGATQVTGRAGGPLPAWKFVSHTPDCQYNTVSTSTNIVPLGSVGGLYIYFYVGRPGYFTLNTSHNGRRAISAATITYATYADGQIYAQFQPPVPLVLSVAAYTYGKFSAGKFDVVWVLLPAPPFGPDPLDDRVYMEATLTNLCDWGLALQNITLGRVGIQSAGIFP